MDSNELINKKRGRKKSAKNFIKRTLRVPFGSPLFEDSENLLKRINSSIHSKKIGLAELFEFSISKIEDSDLEIIASKYRSAEEQLNKNIDDFLKETDSQLSKSEVLKLLSQVNLKKVCKDAIQ